jgi:hypothetical protein
VLSIQEYISINNISRRAVYYKISAGEILSMVMDGRTYILENKDIASPEGISNSFRSELDQLISRAASAPDEKKELISRITSKVSQLRSVGIKLSGYDLKSVYRKIKKIERGETLTRKTRADKFVIKNEILQKTMEDKVLPLASYFYFRNARPNLLMTAKLLQQYARTCEEYYELAAVPLNTLYSRLNAAFSQSGLSRLHQFMNHYNIFKAGLPTVPGAFTEDINFMDHIIGDDHKADVFKVFVYENNKVIEKQVQIWLWIEAKTMYPLGWVIKYGAINQQDLIQSLAKVIRQYGLPGKSIVVDNGIGRGADFTRFLDNISPKLYSFSAAYTPTNKAVMERCFGFMKSELDSFHENFVGPDKRIESRHRTEKLSPEATQIFFEDYKKQVENYFQSLFIGIPRTRLVGGVKEKISIHDYYIREYQNYEFAPVAAGRIRMAMMQSCLRRYAYQLAVKGEKFFSPVDVLPLCFEGEEVRIYYDDLLEEIDIYTVNDVFDRHTGVIYYKNTYLTTFVNLRKHPDKYGHVKQLQNKIKKEVRKIAEYQTAINDNVNISDPLKVLMTPDGELLDQRRATQKMIESELREKVSQIPAAMCLRQDQQEEITQSQRDGYPRVISTSPKGMDSQGQVTEQVIVLQIGEESDTVEAEINLTFDEEE